MGFVQDFIHHTRAYESPTSFWKWAGYAAIAAVLRDSVWLEDGDSRLYPNMYVLFLAGSAGRKGRPVNMAEHIVHIVNNVKVISGRTSIQAILTEIGQVESSKDGKPMIKAGSAMFFAPELAAGIVQDDQSIQILTDIYDYKATGHTTNLIGRGKLKLDKLIFSMLAASNEELLKDVYTVKAVHGGLLSRTFLIIPDEHRRGNAFPKGNEKGFEDLITVLTEVSRCSGAIQWTDEARVTYELWYDPFYLAAKKKKDVGGILGRIPAHVKKLALILAMNEFMHKIESHHVNQAISECLALIPNYNVFTISHGKSTIAECGTIILETLAKSEGLYNKINLLRDNWMHFDAEVLDKTILAFETSGIIKTEMISKGLYYALTDKGKEIMGITNGKEGKK